MKTELKQRHTPEPGPVPHTEAWYGLRVFEPDRKRKVVFGASQASAACGVDRYNTPLGVYLKARQQWEEEFDEAQTERMEFGKLMEPVVLDVYERRVGHAVTRECPMYLHPSHMFMAATPDGIVFSDAEWWIVDAKTTNWRMFDSSGDDEHRFGREGTDEVPVYILFQAQQLCEVMGLDRVDFAVVADSRLKIYRVDRNDELIGQIVSAERELSERIIDGVPPDPTYAHPGTKRLLDEMYGVEVGSTMTLDSLDVDAFAQMEMLKNEIKAKQEKVTELQNRLLWVMGSHERADCGLWTLKRTVVADSVVQQSDVDALQAKIGQVSRRGHVRLTKSRRK